MYALQVCKEEMEPHLEEILSRVLVPNNPTYDSLVNFISSLNEEVVRLSRDSNPLTWKFSVCLRDIFDSFTFVHLSKYGEFVFFLSGECRAQRENRKKTRLLLTDSQHDAPLCAHLEMMCAHHNLLAILL